MLVYVVVFCVAVGIAAVAEYDQRSGRGVASPRRWTGTAMLVAVVLAGVSSLRWRVGTDYWTYDGLFPIYAQEAADGLSLTGEPGLRIIAWISMAMTGDSATMFAIAAFITVGLTIRMLWRWSPAFAFSIALYIVSGAWHESFNGIRQYLACAVIFAGHRNIVDRRLVRWVAVVLIASLFHVSALLMILLYFVPVKRLSLRFQFGVVIAGLLALMFSAQLLSVLELITGDDMDGPDSYAARNINPLRVAFAFVPIALAWILHNREAVSTSRSWFYINMLAVYGATYLASANSALMARYAIYALPFVAIGLAVATSVENSRERSLVRASLLAVYAVFMYIEISGIGNLREFQWIFQRP